MGKKVNKEKVDISPALKKAIDAFPKATILSVGSGFGVTEKKLQKEFKIEIICIDPFRNSDTSLSKDNDEKYEYRKPVDMNDALMPKYPTVNDYLKENKIKGKIILILDWPEPNNSTYDIEAIYALKPDAIVIRYCSCGAAGGSKLQEFLAANNCRSDRGSYDKPTYDKVYEDTLDERIESVLGSDTIMYDVLTLVKKAL